MILDILENSKDRMKFTITDLDVHYINAIRRALIATVPKLAIDKVEIHLGAISDDTGRTYESTTPLFDEIISHRLGLVPIPSDIEQFVLQKDCSCKGEGCGSCQIMYSLNKRGPCTVFSGDLEPLGDEKLKPIDPDIPIVKLTEDEGILIYATAVLGTGKEHAKWQVTQGVGYKPLPDIKVSSKCNGCEECVEACPIDVLEFSKKAVVVARPEECTVCKTCEEVCEPGAIRVHPDTNKYVFNFETDGSVSPSAAICYSLSYLEKMFTDFTKAFEEL
jgi:DNA-directed RNA polymerase subunit D